jgi:hypothetical protein
MRRERRNIIIERYSLSDRPHRPHRPKTPPTDRSGAIEGGKGL